MMKMKTTPDTLHSFIPGFAGRLSRLGTIGRWPTTRFGALLITLALCATGCTTHIKAGARGNIFDAATGLPIQGARITRPYIPEAYPGARWDVPPGGSPALTVISDRHGKFDLPPYHRTDFTLVSHLKPHGADGHFEIAADGYETKVISGRATAQTSWRVEAGKVLLKKP
jgi:hypothetical protein